MKPAVEPDPVEGTRVSAASDLQIGQRVMAPSLMQKSHRGGPAAPNMVSNMGRTSHVANSTMISI